MTNGTGSGTKTRAGIGAHVLKMLPLAPLAAGLGGCVVEQTVTDGSGEVIYQKPVVEVPFESGEKKRERIEENERKLGW